MEEAQQSWGDHGHDAAQAWLAQFRRLVDTPGALPRPISFDSLGLHIMEVQMKPNVWEVRFEDVFVSEGKGDLL